MEGPAVRDTAFGIEEQTTLIHHKPASKEKRLLESDVEDGTAYRAASLVDGSEDTQSLVAPDSLPRKRLKTCNQDLSEAEPDLLVHEKEGQSSLNDVSLLDDPIYTFDEFGLFPLSPNEAFLDDTFLDDTFLDNTFSISSNNEENQNARVKESNEFVNASSSDCSQPVSITGADHGNLSDGFITINREIDQVSYLSHHEQVLAEVQALFHLPDIPWFATDLEDAIRRQQEKQARGYKKVHAILLKWEDGDLDVEKEIEDLEIILRHTYRYEVERWSIPLGRKAKTAFCDKIRHFLQNDDNETLYIIYYAGHGSQGFWEEGKWCS
jgi:hypothetical protein